MQIEKCPSTLLDMYAIDQLLVPFADLKIGKRIGGGGFGEVFRGEYRGSVCAIKKAASLEADYVEEEELKSLS